MLVCFFLRDLEETSEGDTALCRGWRENSFDESIGPEGI
jgi:hypothetical protein